MDDELAVRVLSRLAHVKMTLAVAESLTGGLVASTLVSVPGASRVFRGGVVTYATDTKSQVLGVDSARLARTGPVDEIVACEMAAGVGHLFDADVAVATTGVAGPGPADGHDAGTVWIGFCQRGGGSCAKIYHFQGDRLSVREQTVNATLRSILLNIEGI
ncbi:nicotinamide-nucleotide amidohydrolase family protein [Arcanobacterium buesumense]|uniref:Nicotinamide-nucleotide amidohydrolase family protein n=1 Tax=Arcanobacterium buesumense TaxID=2722751 RepID=A0A6H2ENM0_9ACTO|nr:nicotinamide-nucleotide amidohydrolase family protein [Arcanobacterium buesumense]QJC22667.1 nicotinamide-nucleotide amidohydrolase family protein [Arcanobacterium buesumense]